LGSIGGIGEKTDRLTAQPADLNNLAPDR